MSATTTDDPVAGQQPELKRVMGPRLLLLFIVGDILGAGIYAVTGEMALEVGGIGQPDVREQLGHPLAARERPHVTRERLGADERRPRGPLLPVWRHQHREVAEPGLTRALDESEG